jgi:hypothetical protein
MLSVSGNALDVKAIFECAEVVRMAFSKSMLFCCLFEEFDGALILPFGGSDVGASS